MFNFQNILLNGIKFLVLEKIDKGSQENCKFIFEVISLLECFFYTDGRLRKELGLARVV